MVARAGMPGRAEIQSVLIRGTINGSLAKDMMLGPLIVAFAVQIAGFSNGQISWFLSLVPLLVVARYPFLDMIRHVPRIAVIRWSRLIQLSCMVALFVLPLDWITLPVLVGLALWFVFGNEFLQNAVWMNLVAEVTTRADRGRFLGKLRTWKQATNMAFLLIGVLLVGDQIDRTEHRILLVIVMALLVNSLLWYRLVPNTAPPAQVGGFAGRGQFRRIVTRSPLMRRPLALTFVGAVLHWPILIVYVVGTLHLPADLLLLCVAASMFGSIVSEFVWGSIGDRLGYRFIFMASFAGAVALYPLLLLVPDYAVADPGGRDWTIGTGALLLFHVLRGILNAGQAMASSMYRAHFLDDADGFHALNILTMLNGLFMAGLTALGGLILVALATTPPEPVGPIFIDRFRLITITLMIAAALAGLRLSRGISRGAAQAEAGT